MKMINETAPRTACWMAVDDTECILELTATLLERAGHAEIVRCHSGMEALAEFTAAPGVFDFIVTDLDMPGMNGIELCRQLHTLAPRLPILLVTGSSAITKEEAVNLGFCGLLAKPFQFAELQAAITAAGLPNGCQVETILDQATAMAVA